MYTNGNGNGNGNGHKRTKLTLSDLRSEVGTVDDDPETLGGLDEKRGANQEASPVSASAAAATRKRASARGASALAADSADTSEAVGEDDDDSGVELHEQDEKRGGLKRAVVAFSVIAGALFVVAVAGYFFLFAGSGDESYRVRNTGARSRAGAERSNDNSAQALTVEEIARELNRNGNANTAAGTTQEAMPSSTPQNNATVDGGGSPITDRLPLGDFSTTVAPANPPALQPTQSAGVQNATTTGQQSGVETTTGAATNTRAGAREVGSPNPERSIRVSTLMANNTRGASTANSDNLNLSPSATPERATESVPLPPLGTMLPVRTLGTLYTLRSEGYVRMQLTRAVSGRGWSLPRGTELYGVVRGSDFEIGRAYVQLVGFIDQSSGRLVRLQGSLLGADGADGLRGRKHSLTSGWSRALRIAGAGALEALSTVAATVGRRPVYVGDVYGVSAPRMTSPLMQELNGVAYRQGRAGYVEVPANTSGYILVMTSPREIQGVDADMNMAVEDLRRISDANAQRAATGASEAELAELMTSGDRDSIRRALPRMTPEMRRVAEAVLAGQ